MRGCSTSHRLPKDELDCRRSFICYGSIIAGQVRLLRELIHRPDPARATMKSSCFSFRRRSATVSSAASRWSGLQSPFNKISQLLHALLDWLDIDVLMRGVGTPAGRDSEDKCGKSQTERDIGVG